MYELHTMSAVPALSHRNEPGLCCAELPRGVKRVGMDAYYGCRSLRSLSLPEGLELIELSAFCGCASLTALELPHTLRELGDESFACCTSLRRVEFPPGLRELGEGAFENCRAIEEAVLPRGLKRLRLGSFAGCTSLRRVVLPAGLEELSPYAFYGCTSLEHVEHPEPERFAAELAWTPYGRRRGCGTRPPQLPMELLHRLSGEVPGTALAARGCADADLDRSYSFFETPEPCVYERRSKAETGLWDYELVSGGMERIPGIAPLRGCTTERYEAHHSHWREQIAQAAQRLHQPQGPARVMPKRAKK